MENSRRYFFFCYTFGSNGANVWPAVAFVLSIGNPGYDTECKIEYINKPNGFAVDASLSGKVITIKYRSESEDRPGTFVKLLVITM